MASTVVGLEITEESVRAVEMTSGRVPTLVTSGEVPLPAGAARDSEVLDADAVAVALRQLWAQAGIKGRKVVLAVGSRRVLVREFSTPAMSADLIKASLPFQVQDLLPVPVNQAVLDFYPISEADGMVNGLLVAAVSETIEELIAALAKAKLQVSSVDLIPFGLARIAKAVASPRETAAVVFIGDHTSYVVVATDGVPHFVRVIPIDVATAAVSRHTEALVEEVEEALALVPAPTSRGRSGVRSSLGGDPGVLDLVGRLRSTLSFYEGRPGAAPVDTVYISGAGASVPGVHQALAAAVEAPLRRIDVNDVLAAKAANAPSGDLVQNLMSTLGVLLGEEK